MWACQFRRSGPRDLDIAPALLARGNVVGVKHELRVERYRGRWVAVAETGEVVADADELDVLLRLVERDGPRPDVVVQQVPEANAPMFVGLG